MKPNYTPEEQVEIREQMQRMLREEQAAFRIFLTDEGDLVLGYLRRIWFADKSPFTTVGGRADDSQTTFNLGLQKAFLDLTLAIEVAKKTPGETERQTRAVPALTEA